MTCLYTLFHIKILEINCFTACKRILALFFMVFMFLSNKLLLHLVHLHDLGSILMVFHAEN
jgi:hypothetical protein